jgi:hypothetical protein
MLARLLVNPQIHFDLSKLMSKTADGKIHHVAELSHEMFPYDAAFSNDAANNLRSLFALAFRGAVRQTREFHNSLIPLVPTTAEADISLDQTEEVNPAKSEETAIIWPFSPSLNVAMQGTSTVNIKHTELEEIFGFLGNLPKILRLNIKHFYVTDFKSTILTPDMSIVGPHNEIDSLLRKGQFIDSVSAAGVTLDLKEFDLTKLELNKSVSTSLRIETGLVGHLTADIITNKILPLGTTLKSVKFNTISDDAITKLFQLQKDNYENYPDLIWDTLVLGYVQFGPNLHRFLNNCKYLKKVETFKSNDDGIYGREDRRNRNNSQTNLVESYYFQNAGASYSEWLSLLISKGLGRYFQRNLFRCL